MITIENHGIVKYFLSCVLLSQLMRFFKSYLDSHRSRRKVLPNNELFGKTVTSNNWLFDITVTPNNELFDVTVTLNNELFDVTVTPNSHIL